MVTAEFEEKSYETAYIVELSRGLGASRAIFSPGQVLEKILGFDSAADPKQEHIVWEILNLPRPRGVGLLPTHWPSVTSPATQQLPTLPVSLVLQFKRPEYLAGNRAKQWGLWHRPYYRFERSKEQHQVLRRLEVVLASQVVVRYAAPAFHTMGALESSQIQGSVMARSGHVSPLALGRHSVWTYREPGAVGRGNPNGRWKPFERFEDLFVEYADLWDDERSAGTLELHRGFSQHLSELARTCLYRNPKVRRWVREWSAGLDAIELDSSLRELLVDYVTIQSTMTQIRANWWLLDRDSTLPTE